MLLPVMLRIVGIRDLFVTDLANLLQFLMHIQYMLPKIHYAVGFATIWALGALIVVNTANMSAQYAVIC